MYDIDILFIVWIGVLIFISYICYILFLFLFLDAELKQGRGNSDRRKPDFLEAPVDSGYFQKVDTKRLDIPTGMYKKDRDSAEFDRFQVPRAQSHASNSISITLWNARRAVSVGYTEGWKKIKTAICDHKRLRRQKPCDYLWIITSRCDKLWIMSEHKLN